MRIRALAVALLIVAGGCSVTSNDPVDNPPPGMKCMHAHDKDVEGYILTFCDNWVSK